MGNFFITGLPRSRTAWLSTFLSYDGAFCFHEAMMFCGLETEKIPELFKSTGKEYIGNSCSSISHFLDFYEKAFPDAKYVLIHRDIDDVQVETDKIFGVNTKEGLITCVNALSELARRVKPLIIDFKDLNDVKAARTIWGYCIPAIPFDEMRFKMLNDMDIQLTQAGLDKRRFLCR